MMVVLPTAVDAVVDADRRARAEARRLIETTRSHDRPAPPPTARCPTEGPSPSTRTRQPACSSCSALLLVLAGVGAAGRCS